MDDPNVTMKEYIRLEEEKARKLGKVFNWETAKYGKICTVKRLTKPLEEPEREFRRLGRAVWSLQQNESLAIARRNLFDDEASSSNNTGAKSPTPPRTLHDHSQPNSSSFQNLITLLSNKQEESSMHITSC
nr:hypothetical protein [Tanacetum cinerariifolium]